jgi:hypothetical protein
LADEADSVRRIPDKNLTGYPVQFSDEGVQQTALSASDFSDDSDKLKFGKCGKIGFLPFGLRPNVSEDVAPIYVQT